MRWWQCLSMLDMKELPRLAQHAEELGFEGITLGEHLVTFATQYETYDYSRNNLIRWYPETDWPDPWVQIGALSQRTTRLKFLTTVYVLPLRDPFTAAKAIATAANLSEGRVLLGVGVGWQATEFDVVGKDFKSRGRRTDEMLSLMKKLWTGKSISHEGEFYTMPSLQMTPGLDHPLPILIGGTSPAALERAARHDGFTGAQHELPELERMIDALRRARVARGVSMQDFEIATGLYDYGERAVARCEELGVTILFRDAFCDENGMASELSLDQKLRNMESFAKKWLR